MQSWSEFLATSEHLAIYCKGLLSTDRGIRFVGIADYAGKLMQAVYRAELVPLMDKNETEQYALQTVFRARSRSGFKEKLGQHRFAISVYDNLVRATITVASTSAEHNNVYLLISLDTDADYHNILQNVYSKVLTKKDELLGRTVSISAQYAD
jgi:hypothetical protein